MKKFPKESKPFFKVKLFGWFTDLYNKVIKLRHMKKASWKTTVGGLLIALGESLSNAEGLLGDVGRILTPLGAILLGLAARDNNVTSERAGAR